MKTLPVIDHLKATRDQNRPLNLAIMRWTYHSKAIDGNTLTLQEK